jgi:hypothetical protein
LHRRMARQQQHRILDRHESLGESSVEAQENGLLPCALSSSWLRSSKICIVFQPCPCGSTA